MVSLKTKKHTKHTKGSNKLTNVCGSGTKMSSITAGPARNRSSDTISLFHSQRKKKASRIGKNQPLFSVYIWSNPMVRFNIQLVESFLLNPSDNKNTNKHRLPSRIGSSNISNSGSHTQWTNMKDIIRRQGVVCCLASVENTLRSLTNIHDVSLIHVHRLWSWHWRQRTTQKPLA